MTWIELILAWAPAARISAARFPSVSPRAAWLLDGCSAPCATIPYTGLRFTEEDKPMRRTTIIAAGFAAFTMLALAGPALAGFGALAHDDDSGKYGLSSNEASQGKADDVAMKECGGDKCKIVFRTVAKQCGAIAVAETGGSSAWGGGKAPQRAAAELEAM